MDNNKHWKTSSYSGNGGCVSVKLFANGSAKVRDSKANGTGPVLSFTAHEWRCFLDGVRAGEFDPPGGAA